MDFWDYDFWLKTLFIICVTVVTVAFKEPWLMLAMIILPLVET